MSDVNDGGPAFPMPDSHYANGQVQYGTTGMTLRDYFAAAALQGLLAGYLNRANLDDKGALMIPKSMHAVAYNCADEMLLAKEVDCE